MTKLKKDKIKSTPSKKVVEKPWKKIQTAEGWKRSVEKLRKGSK